MGHDLAWFHCDLMYMEAHKSVTVTTFRETDIINYNLLRGTFFFPLRYPWSCCVQVVHAIHSSRGSAVASSHHRQAEQLPPGIKVSTLPKFNHKVLHGLEPPNSQVMLCCMFRQEHRRFHHFGSTMPSKTTTLESQTVVW